MIEQAAERKQALLALLLQLRGLLLRQLLRGQRLAQFVQLRAALLDSRRIGEQAAGQLEFGRGLVDLPGIQRLADRRVVLEFQLGVLQQRAGRVDGADLVQRADHVVRLVLEDCPGADLLGELGIERVEQVVALLLDLAAPDVQRGRIKFEVVAQLEHLLRAGVVVATLGRAPVRVEPAEQEFLDQVALIDHDALAVVVAERVQRLQRLRLAGVAIRPGQRETLDHFVDVMVVAPGDPAPHAAGDDQHRRHAVDQERQRPLAQAHVAQAVHQLVGALQTVLGTERHAGAQRLVLLLGQALHRRRLAPFAHRHFGADLAVGVGAGEQFERHAAERVDVVAGYRVLALDHLQAGVRRGQRAQRAGVEHGLLARRIAHVLAGAGDAEVEHLGHALAGDHHVGGLEIRMHHAGRMRAAERAGHAFDQRPRLFQRHAVVGLFADQLLEVGTVDVLHRHEDDGAVLVEIVDAHDVVVRQLLRAARLALQRDQRVGMAPEFVIQHLDRDVGVAIARLHLALVARLVDHAHAAATDLAFEVEASLEQRADRDEVGGLSIADVLPAGLAAHAGAGAGHALTRALGAGVAGGLSLARRHRRAGHRLDHGGLVGRGLRWPRGRLDHGGLVQRRRRRARGRRHAGGLVTRWRRRSPGGRLDHGDVFVRTGRARLQRRQLGQQGLGDQRIDPARRLLLADPLDTNAMLVDGQRRQLAQRFEQRGQLDFFGLISADQFGNGIHGWVAVFMLAGRRRRPKCCRARRGPWPARTGSRPDPGAADARGTVREARCRTSPC